MKLTANERKALQAIVDSEYQNGSKNKQEVVGNDIWTQYCNPFSNKRTQSGVYASLSKKWLIQIEECGNMGTVAITESGWDSLYNNAA
ncbi:hypothetical protein [Caudoviricetes sp.]|nr:hypothetical protein [Caudoviricetes sp.]